MRSFRKQNDKLGKWTLNIQFPKMNKYDYFLNFGKVEAKLTRAKRASNNRGDSEISENLTKLLFTIPIHKLTTKPKSLHFYSLTLYYLAKSCEP